jgi:membrane protease YdiL (CAAX protease family)
LSDHLPSTHHSDRCSYCGEPLDQRVYFCLRCAKPHKHPDSLLPASLPTYEDNETKLRTKAGPVWTIYFTYLTVIFIGSFLGFGLWGEEDMEPQFLAVEMALVITTLVFMIRYWSDVKPLVCKMGLVHPATWIGLALLIPLLLLNFGYHSLITELAAAEDEDFMDYFSSSWGPLLFICIMPAIVEELGFRGIIQHQFEKIVSPRGAIFVASVAFSAAHFNVLSAPYLLLVGILLGWMKWKTGSIYPSMAAHFLHNYVVVTHF